MMLALLLATACFSPDIGGGEAPPPVKKPAGKKPAPAEPVVPVAFTARTVADLVDHLEIVHRARPGKELREVIAAIVDAKKPASAGGKDITRTEWARISRELADLGISVALVFLEEIV